MLPNNSLNHDLIDSFSGMSIQDHSAKLLYMDGLNYGKNFFSVIGDHWRIPEAVDKVGKFVQAVKSSGYELKVFLDAAMKTGEAMKKWVKR